MDIDTQELIEKNQKTVFDYLSTTIEVLTENREVGDGDEIDWYRLAEYLGMEMLERCRDFSKWLTRAHSLSGLYGNHKITYKNKRRKKWDVIFVMMSQDTQQL